MTPRWSATFAGARYLLIPSCLPAGDNRISPHGTRFHRRDGLGPGHSDCDGQLRSHSHNQCESDYPCIWRELHLNLDIDQRRERHIKWRRSSD